MASLVSDYGQDYFADTLFGKAQVVPTTWYIALLTQSPDMSNTGSDLQEPPSASGYARVSVTNNATNWGPSAGGVVVNNNVVTFGTATGDWPFTVTDYAFCDAATAGNWYLSGTLRVPRRILSGDVVQFGAGLLAVSISGISQIIVGT